MTDTVTEPVVVPASPIEQQLKAQLEKNRHDSRLRLQLGDLLVLTGKTKEAVAILTPLADGYSAWTVPTTTHSTGAPWKRDGRRFCTPSSCTYTRNDPSPTPKP